MACKGVIFALELGLLPLKEKSAIRHRIESAGASINALVTSSVRVVITTAAVRASGAYKLTSAEKLGIPIFLVEELDEVLSFPPSPRAATATNPSSLRSSAASTTKAPLIDWSSPYADPSPAPSSSPQEFSFLSSTSSSYATSSFAGSYESNADEAQNDLTLGLFASLDSLSPAITTIASAPLTQTTSTLNVIDLYADDEGADGGLLGLSELSDDLGSHVPSFVPAKPDVFLKNTSTRATSVSAAAIADNDEDFEFGDFDLFADSAPVKRPVARAQAASSSYAASKSSLSSTPKKELTKKTPATRSILVPKAASSPAPVSGARLARYVKYREITSKTAEPLLTAPLKIAEPNFTPLGFDLKPSTLTPSPSKPLARRFGPSFTSTEAGMTPLVFDTTFDEFASSGSCSSVSSLRSSQTSISELKATSASEPESLESSTCGSEDEEDLEFVDYSYECDALESKKNLIQAPVKRMRMARIFVDRQTGLMWRRKDAKFKAPPSKLVLDSRKGVSRVFDSSSSTIKPLKKAPAPTAPAPPKASIVPQVSVPVAEASGSPSATSVEVVPAAISKSDNWYKTEVKVENSLVPFNAADLPDFGPPLASTGSKVAKRIFTGPVNAKFSWVDIVTGKASTTKRVPAMDGQKIFISGFSFDDILLHGKPREEQFAFYKEEHLKKMKEKNGRAMRSLKKKQRKAALAAATVAADGTVIMDEKLKAATPKLSDAKELARMKTDEQILNEIVQWPAKKVELAIAQRRQLILQIFQRFGEIKQWSPDYEKGFIHVTYKRPDDARTCMRSLKDFDTRASVIRRLRESGANYVKESYPSPSFYLRWTTCYQRKLNKKAETARQQKLASQDAAVAKHAAQAASATSSISKTVKAKSKAKTAA